MTAYETPGPITLNISLGAVVGNIRLTASDRTDTTVDVRPVDPSSRADQRVFEQTQVEYADGHLTIRAPKVSSLFGRTGGVDVKVELPAGSTVTGSTGMGELVAVGHLAACRFKTGYGEIHVDDADDVELRSGMGDVTVDRSGGAEVTTGSGGVRLRSVEGAASISNSNGTSWIGEVGGALKAKGANGSVSVDRALADVDVSTAAGNIRIGEVVRGAVTLKTAAGGLEVGVRPGTSAWLDLSTVAGRVTNELDDTSGPAEGGPTVEIRARTHVGNIVIRRAEAARP